MATDFSNQVEILGQLHIQHRDDDAGLKDFMEFNDIGLPLAYLASEGLCDISDDGRKYVAETFDLLCVALELDLNRNYDSLAEMFGLSNK